MTAKWLLLRLAGSPAGRPVTVVLHITATSAVLPDEVNPVIRNPRPPVHRSFLHCRQPGRRDIELSDDTAPAHEWPRRVMATS